MTEWPETDEEQHKGRRRIQHSTVYILTLHSTLYTIHKLLSELCNLIDLAKLVFVIFFYVCKDQEIGAVLIFFGYGFPLFNLSK